MIHFFSSRALIFVLVQITGPNHWPRFFPVMKKEVGMHVLRNSHDAAWLTAHEWTQFENKSTRKCIFLLGLGVINVAKSRSLHIWQRGGIVTPNQTIVLYLNTHLTAIFICQLCFVSPLIWTISLYYLCEIFIWLDFLEMDILY